MKNRKLRCLLFALCMVLFVSNSMSPFLTAKAAEIENNGYGDETEQLDHLDVLIAASLFMNSEDPDIDMWPDTVQIQDFVSLYNENGEIVAYYVKLTTGEYAVVNNNIDNPEAIEFGIGDNELIRNLLVLDEDVNIVYNSPTDVYALSNTAVCTLTDEETTDLYSVYPDLQNQNELLSTTVRMYKIVLESQTESQFENLMMPMADALDDDYGIYDWQNIPDSGPCYSDDLPGLTLSWAYDDLVPGAQNHCASICAANVALYFANNGFPAMKINNPTDTVGYYYSLIGDGPVLVFVDKLIHYASTKGYVFNYTGISTSLASIQTAINENRPIALLLSADVHEWHFVLCVGWRQYSATNNFYLRVVNGWSDNDVKFYKPGFQSSWMNATKFWMN